HGEACLEDARVALQCRSDGDGLCAPHVPSRLRHAHRARPRARRLAPDGGPAPVAIDRSPATLQPRPHRVNRICMSVESDRLQEVGAHEAPADLAPSWSPRARRRLDLVRDRVAPLASRCDPDGLLPGPELPGLGIPEGIHFHVLSFEGPDPYARIGGLETRVAGICEALVAEGLETHLWFVGDAARPPDEEREGLQLHRWCQWLSHYHPIGAYAGEPSKVPDYAASLPPPLMARHLIPHLRRGGCAVVLAEEWQTVDAVLHLDHLLRARRLRDRVRILWNANNVFGFDRVDWPRLR